MSQLATDGQHQRPETTTGYPDQTTHHPQGGAAMQLTALLDRFVDDLEGADEQNAVAFYIPCRSNDADLWFAESPDDVEFAKALCRACPVRDACLDGAKQRREPWGVWGGELFVAGVVVPRKRPRGRPRKNDVAA